MWPLCCCTSGVQPQPSMSNSMTPYNNQGRTPVVRFPDMRVVKSRGTFPSFDKFLLLSPFFMVLDLLVDRATGVWRHLGKRLKVSAGSVRKGFSYETEGLNNIEILHFFSKTSAFLC